MKRAGLSGRDVLIWALKEPAWQAQVIAWATRGGWAYYHTHDSRRSPIGFPDLVLIKALRYPVFAELKTMRGIVRPWQQAWIDRLNAAHGCRAYIWRPSDELEIKHVLELAA